ncbi:cell division protein FtsQ/DivIB [Hydrogenophaga sp. 5NK40-0174]|uniref:cell division protein FtsQ/DivIB n=1 Tax=Hydrogenophaga sp. 5NK40-0174 TaxID=3127649 RepID=UPI00310AF484
MAANPSLPMDVRLMTVMANALFSAFAVLCLVGMGTWVVRHPMWAVRSISVHGDVAHQSDVTLRAQLSTQMQTALAGSFLTVDLAKVRTLFESVPWVRQAVVQREFPNRLRVRLEEYRAVAWWGKEGSGQLVGDLGEVFDAMPDESDGMPELAGPAERSKDIWSLYRRLHSSLDGAGMKLVRLELTDRGGWLATLDNEARIELGRGTEVEIMGRVDRFTQTINQMTQRYPGAVEAVDLRYPNGYALRMEGVTTLTEDARTNNRNSRR